MPPASAAPSGPRSSAAETGLGPGLGVEPASQCPADAGGDVARGAHDVDAAPVDVDDRELEHRYAGAGRHEGELVVAATGCEVGLLGHRDQLGARRGDRGQVGRRRCARHGTLTVGLGDRDGLLLDRLEGLAGLLHLREGSQQRQGRGTVGARVCHRQLAALERAAPRGGRLRGGAADQAHGGLRDDVGEHRPGPAGSGELTLPGRAVRDPDLGHLGVGVTQGGHDVLHRARAEHHLDARLVGLDGGNGLLDERLHHRSGGEGHFLRDAVGCRGLLVAPGEERRTRSHRRRAGGRGRPAAERCRRAHGRGGGVGVCAFGCRCGRVVETHGFASGSVNSWSGRD